MRTDCGRMTRPPAGRRAREDDCQLHLELGEAVAAVAGVRLVRDGVRDLAQVGDIEQHDCPRAGGGGRGAAVWGGKRGTRNLLH